MDIHQKSALISSVVIIVTLTSLISASRLYAHVSLSVKSSSENPNPVTGFLGCLTFASARSCADHSLHANHEIEINIRSGWSCVIDCVCLGQRLLFLLCYGTKICGGWRSGMLLSFLIWLDWKYDPWSIGVVFLSLIWSGFWITFLEWPSPISYWWLLIQNSRFIPPKFQIKFKKQAGEGSGTDNKQDGWEDVKGKMKKKQIATSERASSKALQKEENFGGIVVVYITDGSSVESKESPKTNSKLSKCSSGNTDENATKKENIPPNNEDINGPTFEEALDQTINESKTEEVVDQAIIESNLEDALVQANNSATISPIKEPVIDVSTPPGEENPNFKIQENSEYYYEGDVEVGDYEIDYLVDDIPFLEENTGEQINQFPLPDFPTDEEMPYFLMETENLIFKQADAMESMLSIPSSSGSCKRKNQGGDGDTASTCMLGNKKPKN